MLETAVFDMQRGTFSSHKTIQKQSKSNNVFVNNFPISEFGVKVLIQLIFSYKTSGLQVFNRCNFANTYTNKTIVNNATRVVRWVCHFVNRV